MSEPGSGPIESRVVTVDGPAGSGKSTLGRRLAGALGLPFVDTGLFYRGLTVAAAHGGAGIDDTSRLIEIALHTRLEIDTDPATPPEQSVHIDGVLAGPELRDPHLAPLLSRISSLPEIRATLLEPQRELALHGAVAVGRDCGTVVFPHARLKIYLQAPEAVRTLRRARQLHRHDGGNDDVALNADVAVRDRVDTARAAAPLRRAADAHVIDTEQHGIDSMVERALELCAQVGLLPP